MIVGNWVWLCMLASLIPMHEMWIHFFCLLFMILRCFLFPTSTSFTQAMRWKCSGSILWLRVGSLSEVKLELFDLAFWNLIILHLLWIMELKFNPNLILCKPTSLLMVLITHNKPERLRFPRFYGLLFSHPSHPDLWSLFRLRKKLSFPSHIFSFHCISCIRFCM